MKINLPRQLSPRAKKLAIAGSVKPITALLRLGRGAERVEIENAVGKLGGEVRSWMQDSHLASANVPASSLPEVAKVAGIVYVDVGGSMGPSKQGG